MQQPKVTDLSQPDKLHYSCTYHISSLHLPAQLNLSPSLFIGVSDNCAHFSHQETESKVCEILYTLLNWFSAFLILKIR